MGFRTYKATVTFLSSGLKPHPEQKSVDILSREPVTLSDPALLNALRLPVNSTITAVQLSEAA